jgi:hypothetical protein
MVGDPPAETPHSRVNTLTNRECPFTDDHRPLSLVNGNTKQIALHIRLREDTPRDPWLSRSASVKHARARGGSPFVGSIDHCIGNDLAHPAGASRREYLVRTEPGV